MQYQDGFGRRGRFGTVAPPQIPQFPNIDERPSRPAVNRAPDVPQLDIGTPGGLAQNLQAAGVSRGYAKQQALQLNRRQQGHMMHMAPEARTDVLTASMTGTPFYGQQRAVNDASLAHYQRMTPIIEQGAMLGNDSQRIQNQLAPGVINAGIDKTKAETGMTTARTAGIQGEEQRAQGKYGMEMQQAPARFEQEIRGGNAKIGQIEAETGKTKADTTAVDRDYKARISTLEENNAQMQALINDLQQQLGIRVRQQAQQQGGGLDAELGGVNQNQLTPQANPQPSVQMPQAQQANPQRMAQMPQMQQQDGGLDAQAASIQQQFKAGRISREQAAAQLRALGYED